MSEDRTRAVEKPAEAEARTPVKHPPRPVKGAVDVESAYGLARLAERE